MRLPSKHQGRTPMACSLDARLRCERSERARSNTAACGTAPRGWLGACALVCVVLHDRLLSRPPAFAEKDGAAHARASAHTRTLGEQLVTIEEGNDS